MIVCPTVFNFKVLALDIAAFSKPAAEPLHGLRTGASGAATKIPNHNGRPTYLLDDREPIAALI